MGIMFRRIGSFMSRWTSNVRSDSDVSLVGVEYRIAEASILGYGIYGQGFCSDGVQRINRYGPAGNTSDHLE